MSRGYHPPSAPGEASLEGFFRSVDGGNYGVLRQLTGREYALPSVSAPGMTLRFLSVQPDPFAPGSQVCVRLPAPFLLPCKAAAVLAAHHSERSDAVLFDNVGQVAAEDFVLRRFCAGLRELSRTGALQVLRPSQHVLPRSSVCYAVAADGVVTLKLYLRVKLPGHGRRIDGRGAVQILLHELQPVVERWVVALDKAALHAQVVSVQDQEWLRQQLHERELVGFVPDGAVLPRVAGDSDLPLPDAVRFTSPASLSATFTLPFSGRQLSGMGLPRGLTLIAGGGFHGKSTLLRALELGVYNHVPGDGRDFVVIDPTAVKIRAEDRRSIHGVNIAPFISNLPFQKDTTAFSTQDASGSTSQAANIMEALEMGCTALLLDEDTSATNFMYRDALMQQLVPPAQEPITPFVERVRELVEAHGVSAIMVVGGSGQYFTPADVVLVLKEYTVSDCTAAAKAIAASASGQLMDAQHQQEKEEKGKGAFASSSLFQRHFQYGETFSFVRPRKGRDSTKMSGAGLDTVRVAEEDVAVGLVEQLVEEGQLNAIAQCFALVYDGGAADVERAQTSWMVAETDRKYPPPLVVSRVAADGAPAGTALPRTDFSRLMQNCERQLRQARLELQQPSCYLPLGFTTLPRVFELAAAFNRLRTLRIRRA